MVSFSWIFLVFSIEPPFPRYSYTVFCTFPYFIGRNMGLDDGTSFCSSLPTYWNFLDKWIFWFWLPNLAPRIYSMPTRYRVSVGKHWPAIGATYENRLLIRDLMTSFFYSQFASFIASISQFLHTENVASLDFKSFDRNTANVLFCEPNSDIMTCTNIALICFKHSRNDL